MKKYILFIICCIGMGMSLFAQDPHFSQFFFNPTYYNPATLGDFEGEYRLFTANRGQWGSVTTPFKTLAISMEKAGPKLGAGITYVHDATGNAGLRYTNVLAGLSWRHRFDAQHQIGLGLQGGWISKSFNPANFSFDSQYQSSTGYDPSKASGEIFPNTRTTVGTLSLGASYAFQATAPQQVKHLQIGVAYGHINEPNIGFMTLVAHQPKRLMLNAEMDLMLQDRLTFRPSFLLHQQGTAVEKILAAGLMYESDQEVFFEGGLGFRAGDALFPYVGMRMNHLHIGISYDINVSKLAAYSQGRGGAELTVSYVFGAKKPPISNYKERRQRLSRDRDGDGIADHLDKCPDVRGSKATDGCPDTDGDGIIDEQDACPTVAGMEIYEGCPLQDRDGDGIPDAQDACPDAAGLIAFRGCPDQDFDGLPDHVDRCPRVAGPRERAGCPYSDIDADGDEVPDKLDACPLVAGSPAEKGCPTREVAEATPAPTNCGCDTLTEQVNLEQAFGPIEYDTDQAIIKGTYEVGLNRLAIFLRKTPHHQLLIEGHTDDEGDSAYNHALGKSRTLSVMRYLMIRGVRSDRMTMISYGELQPKSANLSAAGRARNRRVELWLY